MIISVYPYNSNLDNLICFGLVFIHSSVNCVRTHKALLLPQNDTTNQ